MKPWVLWCVKYKLKFILYMVWVICFPLYLASYLKEGLDDFKRDGQDIYKLK